MTLQEVISWYQKKIGTYDKQQWEKTVEQRILHGITHVPTKTTKLKTDLIDVDLVRGSSFPKAKPKHGLVTVTRLAFQRLCLLPLYSEWWAQQTSPRLFALLLLIYVLQLFNLLVFTVHSCMLEADSTEHVSSSEIFVPIIMMIVLSIMHSQIVSTNPGPIKTPLQRNRRSARRRRRGVGSLRSRSIISPNDNKSPDVGSVDSDKAVKYLNRVHMRNSEREIKMNKTGTSIRRRKVGWESPVRIGSTKSSPEAQESIKNILETEIISKVVPASTSKEDSLEMFSSVIRRNSSVYSQETSYDRESSKLINKKNPTKRVRANMKVKEDDDGFESNGNGSSENGDDSPSKNPNVKQSYKSKDSSSDTNTSNIKSTLNKCLTLAEEVERVQTEKLNNEFSSVLENNLCAILNDNKVHKIFHVNEVNLSTPFQNAWVNEVLENRSPGILLRESHSDNMESDADTATHVSIKTSMSTRTNSRRRASQTLLVTSNSQSGAVSDGLPMESSGDTEEEGDCETVSSPGTTGSCCALHAEVTTSATEWIGITTNSEECSYSSEIDETDSQHECNNGDFVDHPFAWEFGSNVILGPSCAASDRVSCTIWERRDVKKADLSVLDISSAIIARVETMPETLDYFYCGIGLSVLLSVLPFICRIGLTAIETNVTADHLSVFDVPGLILFQMSGSLITLMQMAFGSTIWEQTIMIVSLLIRMVLSLLFFFLMAIAERIFKQRFLYAKLFSHLTSSRRARKSDLPHFRLNKVRNIKTWLSVRSYLKKRGPQRSVDVIVSAAFIITLLLLSFLSVELLRDSVHLHTQYNLEALVWSLSLGMFLLRFMTLGTKINRKFRNLSVLITEQINMYLQIEQKPHKKDELMVANSVLKLAADLLKELECPFKISGLSANPFLYTITKVVILSALSGVLSEMLGFKLKLHKIKIK